jgi:hypothetical protein
MRLAHSRSTLSTNSLFNPNDTSQFFGETFSPAQDGERLTTQQHQVEAVMADGYWRTLANICAELLRRQPGTKHGEASISARLRDMRRRGWKVERERTRPGSGLYQYRAVKIDSEAIERERVAAILASHRGVRASTEAAA